MPAPTDPRRASSWIARARTTPRTRGGASAEHGSLVSVFLKVLKSRLTYCMSCCNNCYNELYSETQRANYFLGVVSLKGAHGISCPAHLETSSGCKRDLHDEDSGIRSRGVQQTDNQYLAFRKLSLVCSYADTTDCARGRAQVNARALVSVLGGSVPGACCRALHRVTVLHGVLLGDYKHLKSSKRNEHAVN